MRHSRWAAIGVRIQRKGFPMGGTNWLSLWLLLGVLIASRSAPADEKALPAFDRSLVVSGQGYFPVALGLLDGRIAVVLRGGAGHLGLAGRLDIVFSPDEGKTWTKP